MKKALSILLSLILLFGLTACGSATMDSVAADTPSMAPSRIKLNRMDNAFFIGNPSL